MSRGISFSLTEGRNILIAIDGSENSKLAFDYYVTEISKPGDRVIIFHVQQPPTLPIFSMSGGFSMPSADWAKSLSEEATKGKKLIEDYEALCEVEGLHKEGIVKMGKPGELICEGAHEVKADLIVMGSRGNNKMRRTQLGSATDFVLHHTEVPVTVVPPLPKAKGRKKGMFRSRSKNSESEKPVPESVPE